jgi:hypothetical protein
MGEQASRCEARFPSVGRAYKRRRWDEVGGSYLGRPLSLRDGEFRAVVVEEQQRDDEGDRGVGWPRSTGRMAKATPNRRSSARREGDHGNRNGGAAQIAFRDSR